MPLQTLINFTARLIRYADNDNDPYDRETQLAGLAQGFDEQDHDGTKGLPVRRINTADAPTAAGHVRTSTDDLTWWGSGLAAVQQALRQFERRANPFLRMKGTEASGRDLRIYEDAGVLKIQDNTGTEGVPVWTDRWTLNLLTGALSVVTGAITAGSTALTGALTAATGAFTGALSAASVAVTGAVTGATGAFTGALSAGSLTLTTVLSYLYGGTGFNGASAQGQLLIGKADGSWVRALLTAGAGSAVVNGDGTITISNTLTGDMALLADSTLGGAAASFDLTSIPGTYKSLLLHCMLRNANASVTSLFDAKVRFNNDTGTNYHYQRSVDSLAVTTTDQLETQTGGSIGYTPGNNAGANQFAYITIEIPNYAGAQIKQWFSKGFTWQSTKQTWNIAGNHWASAGSPVAAISRITIYDSGGNNWIAGSRVTLWGLK